MILVMIIKYSIVPQSLAIEIVEAIADAKGIDSTELDVSLQEYIDIEAIELLAAHETASWTLSYQLPNHNVTVTSEGTVIVDGTRKEMGT
jgi:hypothetical protein